MPTNRKPPGHLLLLLELAGERGDDDAEDGAREASRPGSPGSWASTDIFDELRRAATGPRGRSRRSTPEGRRLSDYHLIGRLGVGSEGEVWEAVRTSDHWERVALKILRPELSDDPERRAAFLRAAELGRRLVSTALLSTLDVGEADGFVFQAIPMVDGPTLEAAIAGRRRREVEPGSWWLDDDARYATAATRAMARVARAAASAHANGVAHRDIKPANVLLDRARPGRAFLGDFGVGSDLIAAENAVSGWGADAGTPHYMPPERLLRRKSDPVSGDVFALGVTLYEALTLSHPRPVPEGVPRPALPTFLAACEPVPPRERCAWMSRELEKVVLRAMAREPRRRYPTAGELADALDDLALRKRVYDPGILHREMR